MIFSDESVYIIVINALVFAIIMVGFMHLWRKFIKIPIIWIVDDSLEDQQLILRNLDGKKYKIRCFSSPKSLHIYMGIQPPNAVIADYKLNGYTINGDKVVSFCKRHDIPVVIVTGYDGEINHIPESSIIRKHSPDFYKTLTEWLHTKVTTHA